MASVTSSIGEPGAPAESRARRLTALLRLPQPRPDHPAYAARARQLLPEVVAEITIDRQQLPAMPMYALAILDLSRRIQMVEAAEVVATIARDPDTAAHVLKVANSPFYRGVSQLTSLRDAVIRLGRREVGEVAAVAASRFMFNLYTRRLRSVLPRHWYDEHAHAVTIALSASALSRTLGVVDADHAFSCGLFLDIGRTFTLRSVCALIVDKKLDADLEYTVVDHLLDELHVTTGEAALKFWNVPPTILEVCRDHHLDEPNHAAGEVHHLMRLTAGLSMLKAGTLPRERILHEVDRSSRALGLDDAHLEVIGRIVGSMRKKAHALLGERPEATEVLIGL
jgi:HD-like signal output (HDOD) protein